MYVCVCVYIYIYIYIYIYVYDICRLRVKLDISIGKQLSKTVLLGKYGSVEGLNQIVGGGLYKTVETRCR